MQTEAETMMRPTFAGFLREIGLTQADFTRQSFKEFQDWYKDFPDQEGAPYSQVQHAYSLMSKPVYLPEALRVAGLLFDRLFGGSPLAASELLAVLDKSRAEICWYLFKLCKAGQIDRRALGVSVSYLLDHGRIVEDLKEKGRTNREIADVLTFAGPQYIMSERERGALLGLPLEVMVFRGESGNTPTSVAEEISWTLNQDIAGKYAERHAQRMMSEPQHWQGIVSKEDILALLVDRDEGEVLVKPGRVRQLECHVERVEDVSGLRRRSKASGQCLDGIFRPGHGIWKILRQPVRGL